MDGYSDRQIARWSHRTSIFLKKENRLKESRGCEVPFQVPGTSSPSCPGIPLSALLYNTPARLWDISPLPTLSLGCALPWLQGTHLTLIRLDTGEITEVHNNSYCHFSSPSKSVGMATKCDELWGTDGCYGNPPSPHWIKQAHIPAVSPLNTTSADFTATVCKHFLCPVRYNKAKRRQRSPVPNLPTAGTQAHTGG